MIELLLLDWDACVSPYKIYGADGLCLGKPVQDKEFTSIKRFRAAGVPVHVLTGDPWNEALLKARRIPYHITRGIEKSSLLLELCETYNTFPTNVAYLGDDIFDMKIMKAVNYSFCPYDASPDCYIGDLKKTTRLESKAGEHVIMDLYWTCLSKGLIPELDFEEEYAKVLALDKNEKF